VTNHVLPFFGPDRPITDLEATPSGANLVHEFVLHLAGRTDATADPASRRTGTGKLLTTTEAAALIGVSESTIKRRVKEGAYPGSRVDDTPQGRRWLPAHEVVVDHQRRGPRAGLRKATADQVLWALNEILGFAVGQGCIQRSAAEGVTAIRSDEDDARATAARQAPPTLGECASIATALHLVHQLTMWLLRILGLRISEAFGLHVDDVLRGHDGYGVVVIAKQGGRPFTERRPDGTHQRATTRDMTKNDRSHRVVVIPPCLMELIDHVIDILHTDPHTGRTDHAARLIPPISWGAVNSQNGYRAAMKTAAASVGLVTSRDRSPIPHALRKGAVADLAESDLSEWARRRVFGHAPGEDVHARTYLPSTPKLRTQKAAAEAIERTVREEIGTLLVPTLKRPAFRGEGHPLADRQDWINTAIERLHEAGADATSVWCAAERVGFELGLSETAARRLMADGTLSTRDGTAPSGMPARLARLSDVHAYRDRLAASPTLVDVATQLQRDYHEVHRTVQRLGLDLPRHPSNPRSFVVAPEHRRALQAEFDRIAALHARSIRVAEAARILGIGHRDVNRHVEAGELRCDEETDASRARFVTRASVDGLLAKRRATSSSEALTLSQVRTTTGLSTRQITDLIAGGVLTGVPGRGPRRVTKESLQRMRGGYE
jgi:hypothetical protein